MKKEREDILFVFYDIKKLNCTSAELFLFAEAYIKSFGLFPSRSAMTTSEYSSDKTKSYNFIKKKISPTCNIDEFWIGSYLKKEIFDDEGDSDISVGYQKNPSMFYVSINSEIFNDDCEKKQKTTLSFLQYIDFFYGFCCFIPRNVVAMAYAQGISTINRVLKENSPYNLNSNQWRKYYYREKKYQIGDFRDIYPINYISSIHLNRSIFKQNLEMWILSSEKHGTLIQLNEDIWQWSVPEENISYVRETLRPTGLILCI